MMDLKKRLGQIVCGLVSVSLSVSLCAPVAFAAEPDGSNEPIESEGAASSAGDGGSALDQAADGFGGGLTEDDGSEPGSAPQGDSLDSDSSGNGVLPSDGQESGEEADGQGVPAYIAPDGAYGADANQIEEALAQLPPQISTFSAASPNAKVVSFAGATRIETAVMQAKYAFPDGAKGAVIVSSNAWPDALAATSLAGALDYPILYTEINYVPDSVTACLKDLGVSHIIVIGDDAVVAKGAWNDLKGVTSSVERISGSDRFKTQTAIFDYGKKHDLWSNDWVIVASGENFPDALAISPFAAAKAAPIFLTDASKSLKAEQKKVIEQNAGSMFGTVVVIGDGNVVSSATESYMKGKSITGKSVRLQGADRYKTCASVVSWLTSEQGFSWDKAALASGEAPFDALVGGVVQGKADSVIVLTGYSVGEPVKKLVSNGSKVTTELRVFGSSRAIPRNVQDSVFKSLGLMPGSASSESAGISLNAMADLEFSSASNQSYGHYSRSEILEYLDPDNFGYGESGYYQFAVLNKGYSGAVTADQINAFIDSTSSGRSGSLKGMGDAFIAAARTYNVNEVYLLAHAILESGWGTSALATGSVSGYKGYYNFYGIGAWDIDPNNGGAALAKSEGWNTPEKAIKGAAKWIANQYLNNGYNQNTLYKMRWNYTQAAGEGTVWKQYASDRLWANSIARLMDEFYDYNGIGIGDSGLTFLVPAYE